MKDKKKIKKETLTRFAIEGIMDSPRWNNIPCECAQDPSKITERYPLKNCIHCRCQFNQDSLPLSLNGEVKPFKDLEPFERIYTDKKGVKQTVKYSRIKIIRDKRTDEILGWIF
jgi:hypothetical protein